MSPEAVFFDLDGTLADTAPDLASALNELRREHGLPALEEELLRPWTSSGTRGMLHAGFGLTPASKGYAPLAARYLEIYGARPFVRTRLFDGMHEVISTIEAQGLKWGVVTNKPRRLAEPVMLGLGLLDRLACLVGGDCAEAPKPSPAPLMLACSRSRVHAARCIYVGDDERDIVAGRAAGMVTVAAAYGYLGDEAEVAAWGADGIIARPLDLLSFARLSS